MKDLTIKFSWDCMPWERRQGAGRREVVWGHAPRVGDLVNLVLDHRDEVPAAGRGTMVMFRVVQVIWSPDGSRLEVMLESTGMTQGV